MSQNEAKRDLCVRMMGLKRLGATATRNLDSTYQALFARTLFRLCVKLWRARSSAKSMTSFAKLKPSRLSCPRWIAHPLRLPRSHAQQRPEGGVMQQRHATETWACLTSVKSTSFKPTVLTNLDLWLLSMVRLVHSQLNQFNSAVFNTTCFGSVVGNWMYGTKPLDAIRAALIPCAIKAAFTLAALPSDKFCYGIRLQHCQYALQYLIESTN